MRRTEGATGQAVLFKKRSKIMTRVKLFAAVLALCLLAGSWTAEARCNGCSVGVIIIEPDDPFATYSAVVRSLQWRQNEQGQNTSYWQYTTLTGTTMAYCQQQLNAVLASPNVYVVQFCQQD
jgi:ABC-type sugar transport system substrate-binding protein